MKGIALAALAAFLLLDAGLLYGVQRSIDSGRGRREKVEELAALPRGEYLKRVSMGYDALLADLIWFRVVQVMGEKKVPPEHAKWIYHALDVATDLDPKFEYVYQAGGIFLSAVSGEYDLSTGLLKKGFMNNPDVWELPFYAGFNYFFYMQNYKLAAYYMGRAAGLPGRPAFVPLLASRLYAESGDPAFALELTGRVFENTKDDRVRAELMQRMKDLSVEVDLNELEKLAKVYRKERGRYPATVEDLLREGLINRMPSDRLGGRYYFDPSTGEAKNTMLSRRLKVFRREDAR